MTKASDGDEFTETGYAMLLWFNEHHPSGSKYPLPDRTGLVAYLIGWAMGAMDTTTALGARPALRPAGYSHMVIVFAAVSQVALAHGLLEE